jgi:hypothetical protein
MFCVDRCYLFSLQTTCCCCIVIRAARSDDSSGQNYGGGETTVATTQSSGQLTQDHRQSFTMAQLHERQEIVEANGMVFLRKIIRGEVIEVLKKRLVILLGLKLSYQKKGGEQLMIEF